MAHRELIKNSLKGLFCFDAVASPTHWYYDRRALQRTYGSIDGYVKPSERMQGSIMSLSNTGGAGRGSNKSDLVGQIILHGKKKYWGRGANYHYHATLSAGENTLEASLVRVMLRTLANSNAQESIQEKLYAFRERYVTFMTTPDTHNDAYASTCHRMFFANRERGLNLDDCPDNDHHNVDAMDALTLTVPVILHMFEQGASDHEIRLSAFQTIQVTRGVSTSFETYSSAFSSLLLNVLRGEDVRSSVEKCADEAMGRGAGARIRQSVAKSAGKGDPMVACYIDSSFPAMLFMLHKYADSDMATVACANANAGGENVARGAVLGAVLGARHGGLGSAAGWLEDGLFDRLDINQEIDAVVTEKNEVVSIPAVVEETKEQSTDQRQRTNL
jgi:ADP-ribosyl-[dinitrogen reductase] hydrolase